MTEAVKQDTSTRSVTKPEPADLASAIAGLAITMKEGGLDQDVIKMALDTFARVSSEPIHIT